MSAAEFILQLLDLGQRMREDIRPADDSEGLAKQWDDVLAKVAVMELNEEWRFLHRHLKRPAIHPPPVARETTLPARTDQEVIDQTNELARELYRIRGYIRPRGYRFDKATHPHEVESWSGACEAQRMLTLTDPDDALMELEEEDDT